MLAHTLFLTLGLLASAHGQEQHHTAQPPALHFTLERRGGIFAGANWTANLPFLLEQLHLAESRYNLTQREVRGNKIVRVPKAKGVGGGEGGSLMGDIGRDGNWYATLRMGASMQPVQLDIDMLISDFVVRSTTSQHGAGFDELFSNTYTKDEHNQVYEHCFYPEDSIYLPTVKQSHRLNFPHCKPSRQSRETLLPNGAILGLAPSDSLRQVRGATLMRQLMDRKIIEHNVFSTTLVNGNEGLLSIGGTAAESVSQIEAAIEAFLGKPADQKPVAEQVHDAKQDKIDLVNGASDELVAANQQPPPVPAGAPPDAPSPDQGGIAKRAKRGLDDMGAAAKGRGHRAEHKEAPSWRDAWKWSPVEGAAGWWQTLMRGVWVDGTKVLKNQPCLLDMNVPFILAPPLAAKAFYASISGARRLPAPYSNFYAFPCNNPPMLHLEFGGWRFPVMRGMKTYDSSNGPNGKFSLGKVSYESGYCVGAVVETRMGVGDQAPLKHHSRKQDALRGMGAMESGMLAGNGMRDVWVLGEPAFRGLGVAFDITNNEVGFRTY